MLRTNVRGNRGPRRTELPSFKKLGTLEPAILQHLESIIDASSPESNDLYGDHYVISKECPLRHDFPRTYRQILLQTCEVGREGRSETDYNVPAFEAAVDLLKAHVPWFYRARLAVLEPGETIDWHIDTDTSVSCRVAAVLRGGCHWSIRRRDGEIEDRALEPGEMWFTNTGWPHRVTNHLSTQRWCLLMGTNYDSIARYF